MTQYKSEFLQIVEERGFIYQGSDLEGLDAKLCDGVQTGYLGFDATAKSYHVGNLCQIMLLYWFQQCGHKPITLMGGGTTKVGDPSGKDDMRKMLTDADIDENIQNLQKVFAQFLTYGDGDADAIMVNNDEWLSEINYISFLRDYGRHFSINRMLTFESVKQRLEREQNLSFLEFNYSILQAYDFVELNKRYDAVLQMGGSDQWGNIVSGVDLGRRVNSASLFALTTPLLTTADGKKMGKTEKGAVWISSNMLPSYDYYQFWRNADDADVGKLLKIFTTLPMDEVRRLEALKGREINDAKKILAFEATKLCHGEQAAKDAEGTAQKVFEQGSIGDDLPSINVEATRIQGGVLVLDLLVEAGLVSSKGEGRRLLKGGGAKVNDNKVAEDYSVSSDDLRDDVIKLSAGKKKHTLIRLQ
jgi:tyrosyl-tRNA synthetase